MKKKKCHDCIDKVVKQLTGKEVIVCTEVELVKGPIYKEGLMILTHLKSQCKVCREEYSYLVKSCWVDFKM